MSILSIVCIRDSEMVGGGEVTNKNKRIILLNKELVFLVYHHRNK